MSIFVILILLAITLCCIAGIVLQFYAWRHLKPGIPRYGHKDSMFRKRADYYTEDGMRYIEMQKKLTYVMFGLFVIFIVLIETGVAGGTN